MIIQLRKESIVVIIFSSKRVCVCVPTTYILPLSLLPQSNPLGYGECNSMPNPILFLSLSIHPSVYLFSTESYSIHWVVWCGVGSICQIQSCIESSVCSILPPHYHRGQKRPTHPPQRGRRGFLSPLGSLRGGREGGKSVHVPEAGKGIFPLPLVGETG